MAANETESITVVTSLSRFSHSRGDIVRIALWTKWLIRVCYFVIIERRAELIFVALKAQLLSKFTVLVFEF
jgi:hypothetical protein